MNVLVTNDDGYRSPLLWMLVKAMARLPWVEDLQVAVPDGEQSWKSHAMSGLGAINPRRVQTDGHEVTLVDGTPADCVDWAMHNLFAEFPDLVVSGVNCGHNSGLGFVMSSATVGACWHANLVAPPRAGVAISQHFPMEGHRRMRLGQAGPEELAALEANVLRCLDALWAALRARPDFPSAPVTWSANFPIAPAADLRVIDAVIGDSRLAQCFQEREGRFEHALVSYIEDEDPASDGMVMRSGHISLSRIDLRVLCSR